MKRLFLFFFVTLSFLSVLYGGEATVIKVNSLYGIIDRGENQGITEGEILIVKRQTSMGLKEIGKVKVIRATANRAAVKQISDTENPILLKGDHLHIDVWGRVDQAKETASNQARSRTSSASQRPTASDKGGKDIPLPDVAYVYSTKPNLRQPWVGLNAGSVVPTGSLSSAFSPSFQLGLSYMLAAGPNLNVGIEVNNTFLSDFGVTNRAESGIYSASASILEGLVVFQTFVGDFLFFEGGGGLYRPKVQTTASNNSESTFSSTNFGVFGGTGIFVRTSPYAGFSLKGRFHNYFDNTTRQYYGVSGGFRFRLNGFK